MSLGLVFVAAVLLAIAGRLLAEGIHGPPEPSAIWAFTVGGEELTTIASGELSQAEAYLWGGGLAVAGCALLVLGVRRIRRSAEAS